jgi:hypothetical protein
VAAIPAAVDLLVRREGRVLEAARAEGFDVEKLKVAIGESAEIH